MADSGRLRSIPLDHSGVLRLGESLAHWAKTCDDFNAWGRLQVSLRLLKPRKHDKASRDDVELICAKHFCFRWTHFRDFPRLVFFVKPDLPDPYDFDQETPIAQRRASDPLPPLLEEIFAAEVARLTGREPDYLPDPLTDAEGLFFVTICELCEAPRLKGAPKGRRYADGLPSAVAEARALLEEAERSEDVWNPRLQVLEPVYQAAPLTVEAAARDVANRWFEQDRVMAQQHWEKLSAYEKRRVIVAIGVDAAQRRIREVLAKATV